MATLIEAFDSTMKEALAGFKVFLWAVPITLAYVATDSLRIIIASVVAFFIFGFIITLSNNVIAKAPMILPGINFLAMIKNAILGIIAILPHVAIAGAIIWGYSFVTIPIELWDITFKIVVALFALAFPLTGVCILIRRMNPFEAYNIKKFCSGVGEVFLSYSTFAIRALLGIAVILGFLCYLFSLFIGFDNLFWVYVVAVNVMFFIILFSNALAQISDDIYTFPEQEAAKKKQKEAMDAMSVDETQQ